MKQRPASRASAQFWIKVASDVLSEQGPDELTIDGLCRKARKTKGSFYAHFESYDVFLSALASYWRETSTQAVIDTAEKGASPHHRLTLLNNVAVQLDAKLDQGMRRLAERSEPVSRVVAEVDDVRIAYLASLYAATGGYSDNECTDLATIEYAAYIGLQQINRAPCEQERLYETFAKLIIR